MLAAAAVAQDVGAPGSDFRASSGLIQLVPKHPKQLSGSFGMTFSRSSVSSGSLRGYDAALGGTVIDDRLWFFAAAQQDQGSRFASAFPQTYGGGQAFEGKMTAQLGGRNSLAAAAGTGSRESTALPALPSSFLSFRFNSVLSSNSFFSASFSQRKAAEPVSPFAEFAEPR